MLCELDGYPTLNSKEPISVDRILGKLVYCEGRGNPEGILMAEMLKAETSCNHRTATRETASAAERDGDMAINV